MTLRALCILAIAFAPGCGRVAAPSAPTDGPMGPAVVAPAPVAPMVAPADLAAAEAAARPYLGAQRDAALTHVSVSAVKPDGTLADMVKTQWELGFWVKGESGYRYCVVTIDYRGRGRMNSAFGTMDAPPQALSVAKLPPLGAAIARARAAGLAEAGRYDLELRQTPQGPELRVAAQGKAGDRVTVRL